MERMAQSMTVGAVVFLGLMDDVVWITHGFQSRPLRHGDGWPKPPLHRRPVFSFDTEDTAMPKHLLSTTAAACDLYNLWQTC